MTFRDWWVTCPWTMPTMRSKPINLVLASGHGKEPSLQGELYTAYAQTHYESLAERGSLLYSGRKFSADLLYSYTYDRDRRVTDKEALPRLPTVRCIKWICTMSRFPVITTIRYVSEWTII